MKRLSGLLTIPLAIGLAAVANCAHATSCYEESPAHASQGDEYYEIDVTPPPAKRERDLLRDLFKAIQGKWVGRGTEFFCEGPERRAKRVHKKYKAGVNITAGTDFELRIRTEKEFIKEKIKKSDVADLLRKNSHYHITSLTKTGISATEKYRRGAGRHGSGFWEVITVIKARKRRLSIRTTRYLNGFLASVETKELRRGG